MSAFAAAHVVTPLVLLDGRAATRAFLGVSRHPQSVSDVGTRGAHTAPRARELHLFLQFSLPSFPVAVNARAGVRLLFLRGQWGESMGSMLRVGVGNVMYVGGSSVGAGVGLFGGESMG